MATPNKPNPSARSDQFFQRGTNPAPYIGPKDVVLQELPDVELDSTPSTPAGTPTIEEGESRTVGDIAERFVDLVREGQRVSDAVESMGLSIADIQDGQTKARIRELFAKYAINPKIIREAAKARLVEIALDSEQAPRDSVNAIKELKSFPELNMTPSPAVSVTVLSNETKAVLDTLPVLEGEFEE